MVIETSISSLAVKGNGWQWLAMAGNGWEWLAMVLKTFDRLCSGAN